ncbi:MAG: TetR family transcriptional regulator [Frondihabitans sp.]|nr:TetR family transcriptional regulator [Frondihabitans sp.]
MSSPIGTPAVDERRDGRRTDTRRRIQDIALDVFAERGWDAATLREIAERLAITRPALYYHFRSKEDILASVHRDLAESLDGIIEWAGNQPASAQTRAEVLRRMSALMSGSWGAFLEFAQRNEAAMRDLKSAAEFIERMDILGGMLRPDDTIPGRIKARLALDALFMATARGQQLGGSIEDRAESALAIAVALTR